MIFEKQKQVYTQELNIVINSPQAVVWEGKADSVSTENSLGTFDILPGHANFVTMIENKPIIIRHGSQKETFNFMNALLSVSDGQQVTIYAEI